MTVSAEMSYVINISGHIGTVAKLQHTKDPALPVRGQVMWCPDADLSLAGACLFLLSAIPLAFDRKQHFICYCCCCWLYWWWWAPYRWQPSPRQMPLSVTVTIILPVRSQITESVAVQDHAIGRPSLVCLSWFCRGLYLAYGIVGVEHRYVGVVRCRHSRA